MSSGSKKPRRAPARKPDGAPPELQERQLDAWQAVAASDVASELVFGGGAALAMMHLHHRRSEDLDFFLQRELAPGVRKDLA
ncbi:MAG: nucleotidyl transferase AbiEii/AbiGii toxin family protein [Myxococcales bacterium]|nr:nucleotidyl transferase AbiEii/AbiGii toxin family protein [Myxococcales bacterium]